MQRNERIEWEVSKVLENKATGEKKPEVIGEQHVQFYIISRIWMEKWHKFVKMQGEQPPVITNKSLLDKIEKKAILQQGKDYVVLTKKVWQFFQALYDGKTSILINIRGEGAPGDAVDLAQVDALFSDYAKPNARRQLDVSVQEEKSNIYKINDSEFAVVNEVRVPNRAILKMPLAQRKKMELNKMQELKNKLQNSGYYLVDAQWITAWVANLQNESEPPIGKIDNLRILEEMKDPNNKLEI